jgi:hypothetical protein
MVAQGAPAVGRLGTLRRRTSGLNLSAVLAAIWLIVGSVFGLVCGLLAIRRNRSAVGWFLLGLGVGPIALVWLLVQRRGEQPAFL